MQLPQIKRGVKSLRQSELVELAVWLRDSYPEVQDSLIGIDSLNRKTNQEVGSEGVEYIAKLIGGTKRPPASPYDILSQNGLRIEVKLSKLGNLIGSGHRFWTWAWPLGAKEKKVYDSLVLVAKPNPCCVELYAESGCQYVLFDIPFREVLAVMNVKNNNIAFNSNPSKVSPSNERALRVYREFQITHEQLRERYIQL